jgi:hypothetical protein
LGGLHNYFFVPLGRKVNHGEGEGEGGGGEREGRGGERRGEEGRVGKKGREKVKRVGGRRKKSERMGEWTKAGGG